MPLSHGLGISRKEGFDSEGPMTEHRFPCFSSNHWHRRMLDEPSLRYVHELRCFTVPSLSHSLKMLLSPVLAGFRAQGLFCLPIELILDCQFMPTGSCTRSRALSSSSASKATRNAIIYYDTMVGSPYLVALIRVSFSPFTRSLGRMFHERSGYNDH